MLGLEFNDPIKELRPDILCHPNIPKPLHGRNPRTIMGKKWWDDTRFQAQREWGFRCAACGVHKTKAKIHKWLEGHEFFDMDFKTGRCEVKEIVPLCHYCHNFIHSGRPWKINTKTAEEKRDIIRHGFNVLQKADIFECSEATWEVARLLNVSERMVFNPITEGFDESLRWEDFHLILEGTRFDSLYKSYEEWKEAYS
jgi:hypothetical protein